MHRSDMAKRFQNRIDYVDIKAYGVGKVHVESSKNSLDGTDNSASEGSVQEEGKNKEIHYHAFHENKLIERIVNFEK